MLIITATHHTDTDEVAEHLERVESRVGHHLTDQEFTEEFEHFVSTPT